MRSAWKAARCIDVTGVAPVEQARSRVDWDERRERGIPPVQQARELRLLGALGFEPKAMRIASGTPSSVADGSPASPGTNVSQIASRAVRALPLISSIGGASKIRSLLS